MIIDARDARKKIEEIHLSKINTLLGRCENAIDLAIRNGEEVVHVNINKTEDRFIKTVICELEKLRYKVKREEGYDQREQTGWDYLIIQW